MCSVQLGEGRSAGFQELVSVLVLKDQGSSEREQEELRVSWLGCWCACGVLEVAEGKGTGGEISKHTPVRGWLLPGLWGG